MYEPTTPLLPPPPPQRRTGRAVLIVVGLVAFACCIAGAAVFAVGAALHRDGVTPARTYAMGDAVRDGKFEFIVSSVDCGGSELVTGLIRVQAQGQFCVVELSVRNIGTEPRDFADRNQKAYSPHGVQYAPDTGIGVIANGSGVAYWSTINPGNSVQGKIVFDIPAESTISIVEFHDSALSGGVKVAVTAT